MSRQEEGWRSPTDPNPPGRLIRVAALLPGARCGVSEAQRADRASPTRRPDSHGQACQPAAIAPPFASRAAPRAGGARRTVADGVDLVHAVLVHEGVEGRVKAAAPV